MCGVDIQYGQMQSFCEETKETRDGQKNDRTATAAIGGFGYIIKQGQDSNSEA